MNWTAITEALKAFIDAFSTVPTPRTIPLPIPQKPEEPKPPQPTPLEKLIVALIKVESNGNDNAIGDKHLIDRAYGCLQIRRPVCLDVNRVYGTNHSPMAMLGNRTLSIQTAYRYWNIYLGDNATNEDRARVWNGGPTAWKKGTKMYKATNGYWAKVKKHL